VNSSKPVRMTNQRRIILDEVRKLCSHPTAMEVYEIVRKRIPHVSLGTVYRNLEFLSDMGLIQKLEMAGSQKRFDGNVKNHYHIRCIRCHRVQDLFVDPIAAIDEALLELSDFEVMWHRLEFVGLCRQCRQEQESGEHDLSRPVRSGSLSHESVREPS
jgi:Fur family transcriptional regulator, peroxide stress response regulator